MTAASMPVASAPHRHRHALSEDAMEAFRLARLVAVEQCPYFGHALFAVTPVAAPGLGTFGVDASWRLYMDPTILVGPDARPTADVAAILLHEIGHLLRDHAARAALIPQVDHNKFNVSGDAEINDDLLAGGVALPADALLPQHLHCPDGWAAEAYYAHLMQPQPPMLGGTGAGTDSNTDSASESSTDDSSGGSGSDDDNGTGDSASSHDPGDGSGGNPDTPHTAKGTGTGAGAGGECGAATPGTTPDTDPRGFGCGSGSGNQANPGEIPATDQTLAPITAADADLIRRQVAHDVRDYASKGRGTMPAGRVRWADDILTPPTVPWQRVFRAQVRRAVADKAGQQNLTYKKPSRRHPHSKIVFPSRRKPQITVGIVIDTSGSMGRDELQAVASETHAVLTGSGVRPSNVTIITCDAAASTPQRVQRVSDVAMIGGGGTDMRVGIDYLEGLGPTAPDIIVVLTDGYTPWPDTPTRARLVCGITRPAGADISDTPPWAITAHIPTGTIT